MKLKNVFYGVSNMGEMVEFYEKVLGLPLQFVDSDQWAQFKVGDVSFALGGARETPKNHETGAVVTFEVDDIKGTKNNLEKNGIKVSDVRDMGAHGKVCSFYDPSKNIVQLYQK